MTKRVLLCDDEMHILRAAEFKLKRDGFEVICAENGEVAWESILEQKPHVLVTDCQMPKLDGIGLVDRIRNHPEAADLPVLMLTAKSYELAEEVQRLDINAVIAKPFSPRELANKVAEVVETGTLNGSKTL